MLVESARFPPQGTRGFGLLYADVWEPEGLPATMAKANDETLLLAQIETAAGLDVVDEIAAVEGLDVLWIGQFDLTTSLGIPEEVVCPATKASPRLLTTTPEPASEPASVPPR